MLNNDSNKTLEKDVILRTKLWLMSWKIENQFPAIERKYFCLGI